MTGHHTRNVILRPELEAVSEARALTQKVCGEAHVSDDLCEVAVLLTSETVTNAIIHGRSEVHLAVTAGPEGIRVEVGDANRFRPTVRAADDGALGGRGLRIVAAAASSWGIDDNPDGKTVWFELTSAWPLSAGIGNGAHPTKPLRRL